MSQPRIIPVGETLPPVQDNSGQCPPREVNARPHAPNKAKPRSRAGKDVVKRRFVLLNAFLDDALATMSRSELSAWLLLYRHAKADGIVSASMADLARRAGCSARTMQTALAKLQTANLVERIKRGSLAGGPSVWRLLTPEGDRP